MPGYRAIAVSLTGPVAEGARAAEAHQREGDSAAAVRMLEEALAASLTQRPEMPGWLVGRLAALYRSLERYDDEVFLLERYQKTQSSEESRTRYDARLSKARTIAARKRPRDSEALASVRRVMGETRSRARKTPADAPVAILDPATVAELARALADESSDYERRVDAALARLSDEARARSLTVEHLVVVLMQAASHGPAHRLEDAQRTGRYGAALLQLLALYYGERVEEP